MYIMISSTYLVPGLCCPTTPYAQYSFQDATVASVSSCRSVSCVVSADGSLGQLRLVGWVMNIAALLFFGH